MININREDIPLYVILVALGSGGGTVGGNFLDSDDKLIEQQKIMAEEKEIAQWKQITANKDNINAILLRECE